MISGDFCDFLGFLVSSMISSNFLNFSWFLGLASLLVISMTLNDAIVFHSLHITSASLSFFSTIVRGVLVLSYFECGDTTVDDN